MPIPFLFSTPSSPAELRRFFFWHANDHLEIQQAVQKQKSINIFGRVLDPVDLRQLDAWIEQHQQAHNDTNEALKLNGQDLTNFDPRNADKLREWVYLNAEEHLAMRQALAI